MRAKARRGYKMKQVLCIAEVCCDIIFGGLSKIPVQGEEEYCEVFDVKAGGGANTAMGLSRLDIPVSMFTRLGDDEFGRIVLKHMIESGINKESIMLEREVKTAVSAVMSTVNDRCFASFGGSGSSFLSTDQEDRLERAIALADHIHTNVSYCINSPIVDICKKYKRTLSLDSSWMPELDLSLILPAISYCTYFTPNEVEAMQLTKSDTNEKALALLTEEAPGTIITLGVGGSITISSGKLYHQPNVTYGLAVDSTGAGDMYLSGLIYGLVNGASKEESMRIASHTAGYSVTYYGGVDESFCLEKLKL